MHGAMQSFIIHMQGDEKRAPNAQKLLRDLPNAEIVPAVNGYDAAQIADVVTHPGDLFSPRYPFSLRPAEIGVFQSHRKCWQMILDRGLDYAVIVEDDLQIDPTRFQTAMDLIRDHATTDMYIRLPAKNREVPGRLVARSGTTALFMPRWIGLQCICQVVGKGAAKRMLKASNEIDRPVDTLLQMHWETGQKVHVIHPTGNREIASEIGGSTIQQKIRGKGKLTRERQRAWYRAQIALHPQRS